jgi:hypothetical protein
MLIACFASEIDIGETFMRPIWWHSALVAVVLYVGLLAFALVVVDHGDATGMSNSVGLQQPFDSGRKNYATAPKFAAAGQPIGESQKYEKIATLTELTSSPRSRSASRSWRSSSESSTRRTSSAPSN